MRESLRGWWSCNRQWAEPVLVISGGGSIVVAVVVTINSEWDWLMESVLPLLMMAFSGLMIVSMGGVLLYCAVTAHRKE